MLLRLMFIGASALLGASIGYQEGRKDALREKAEYPHIPKHKPSLPQTAKNLVSKTAQSLKKAASDITSSQEYVDFKTKFSREELMHILCNNQVFDTVNDILKQNNGEYRPGYYFKGKEWDKYQEAKQEPTCTCQSNVPSPEYVGASVNITKNK